MEFSPKEDHKHTKLKNMEHILIFAVREIKRQNMRSLKKGQKTDKY